MVQSVTYFIHPEYNVQSYESCRGVTSAATSGSVMTLLCGPWGPQLCTPERWFEYMGSMTNGYSPFNIFYKFTNETSEDGRYFPHNPLVVPCNQPINNSSVISEKLSLSR